MKLSKAEFADALQKGKGRAYLHMRSHSDKGMEDVLLEACLRSLVYDDQCEDTREQWLIGLTDLAKNPKFYHDGVVDNFLKTTNFCDVQQQSAILRILASRGYSNAKELLYQKFDLQEFDEDWLIAVDIVKLDGAKGMLYVAETSGKRIRDDSSYWVSNTLINTAAEEMLDRRRVLESLCKAAKSNPNINSYIENVLATSGELLHDHEKFKPTASKPLSLDEFLASVNAMPPQISTGACFRFGQHATPEELGQVFSRLLAEKDEKKLLYYLSAFRWAELPEDPSLIFPLTASPNNRVRYAALAALANVKNPAVREFALARLEHGQLEGLKMLTKNFEEGDFSRIFSKIPLSINKEEAHAIVSDILDICEYNNSAEAADCLIWGYENTPCSMCRSTTVTRLLETDMLPEKLAEECAFDCDKDTRALVKLESPAT